MHILAVISGEYGRRHVENIRAHGPANWQLATWQAPGVFPPVIDYPEDYLPDSLPPADLILSFAEQRGVAELLPDMARMCGAKAVLAPIDSETWLPTGLARQLRGWLERMGVVCATPKPLCSLTENQYTLSRSEKISYQSEILAAFARHFGKPELELEIDPQTRLVTSVSVKRDAVCGCARYVAEKLVGVPVDDAEEKAGLLHHHYPCLASMGIDPAFGDTLMHVSGNILKNAVSSQVKPFRQVRYFTPGQKVD